MFGVVTPYTIGYSGLFLAVLPLHPLGNPAYMLKAANKFYPAALLSYSLGLACALYSVYGMAFHRPFAIYFVFPALLYWFIFTEPGKADDNMKQHEHKTGTQGGADA